MKKKILIRNQETKKMEVREMTLEEVVVAFERMTYKNAIVAFSKVSKHQSNVNDIEDINSLGLMELCDCYERYDLNKGAFSTILTKALERLTIRLQRDLFAQMRTTDKVNYSLDVALEERSALGELVGEYDTNIKSFEIRSDLKRVIDNLNEQERRIYDFLITKKKTKKEFAVELGITRPTLNTKINDLMRKLSGLLVEYR